MEGSRKQKGHLILMLSLMMGVIAILDPVDAPATVQDSEIEVRIVDFAFEPATLEVPAGTTVVWTNGGSAPHTVTSDAGVFDSGRLDPGGSFSMTFDTPGTYTYHCEFHPDMHATIVVTGEQTEDEADATATVPADAEATDGVETGADSGEPNHLAHIHAGTCDELGIVVYSLSSAQWAIVPMEGAETESVELIAGTANVPLEDVFNEPFSVHIHESEENKQNYVGCAEIGGQPEAPWSPEDGLVLEVVEQADSGHRGIATLRPDTGGATTVTLVLVTASTEEAQAETAAPPPGTTYTSPTYQYSITYGPSWTVDTELSSNGIDQLELTNGTSYVDAIGTTAYDGDLDRCVEGVAAQRLADPRASNIELATDERGQPIQGGTEATGAFAIYDHDYTLADGATEPWTLYIQCIPLVPGEAVLAFVHNVPSDAYDEEVEARQALLRGLTLPQ